MINVFFTENSIDELLHQSQYIYMKILDADKADRFLLTMKRYIKETLGYFPRLGRPANEFGWGIRKLIYQKYSILYEIKGDTINILSIYRENLPTI